MQAAYASERGEDVVDNPMYLKKKVKSGHVSVDFEMEDLILTYEVEATVVGETGRAMQNKRKTHRKRLGVKVDAHTNVKEYAKQLVRSSELIPNNKVEHVESLLGELKDHILSQRNRSDSVRKLQRDAERKRKEEKRKQRKEEKERQEADLARAEVENAAMDDLDEYVERLYEEDTAARILGANMIMRLAQEAENLEDLLANESMMGALARTLKEDYKKSMELASSIMNVFLCLSNFSQFHQSLHGNQVGNNTMQIIKWELERYAAREKEMKVLEQIAQAQERGEDFDPRKGKKKGEPVNMAVEQGKTKKLLRKQDKLLFVCFHVLLNLAEDEKVEKKMAKRGLVDDIVKTLGDRPSTSSELLILAATFLKKLSVTRENKDELVAMQIVEPLSKFLSCSNDTLKKNVLTTLFNLSFDPAIREQMVQHSLIPKFVELVQEKQFRGVSIRILYHLSKDDKCKSMFTYTDIIPYITRMIIDFPSNHVASELAALAVNLTLHPRICAVLLQGGQFKQVIERALKRRDPLLLKVVKNVARYTLSCQEEIPDVIRETGTKQQDNQDPVDEGKAEEKIKRAQQEMQTRKSQEAKKAYKYRGFWESYIREIVKLVRSTEYPSLMFESIGILSNLTPADLPKGSNFADLILENDLVEHIHKQLLPGFSEDDMILELIILIGQFCLDQAAARVLANSPLIKLVYDLLHEKSDDSEIVLQTLFTFHRLLRHNDTGYSLLYETQMPRDVCELLVHRNKVVRVMADTVLDQIVDHDEANENAMHLNRKLARKAVRSENLSSKEQKNSRGRNSAESDDDDDDDDNVHYNPETAGFSELRGSLSKMIRAKRYEILNKEWIEVVAQDDLDDLDEEEDDRHYDSASPTTFTNYRIHGHHQGMSDISDEELLEDASEDDDISTEY